MITTESQGCGAGSRRADSCLPVSLACRRQENLRWGENEKAGGVSEKDGLLVLEGHFLSPESKNLILHLRQLSL